MSSSSTIAEGSDQGGDVDVAKASSLVVGPCNDASAIVKHDRMRKIGSVALVVLKAIVMGEVCALIKNGMWDDPAVAEAGFMFLEFNRLAQTFGYRPNYIARFLTWRCSYLICGICIGLAQLTLSFKTFDGHRARYDAVLEQVPEVIPREYFSKMTAALAGYELSVWILSVSSLCGTMVGTCLSFPIWAMTRTRLSMKILRASWLANFLLPFGVVLVFPIRTTVDWNNIVFSACEQAVQYTFDMPGSTLRMRLSRMDSSEFPSVKKELGGLPDDIPGWCQAQGPSWHQRFYSATVRCLWLAEDECRKVGACSTQVACLRDCLGYALQQDEQGLQAVDMYNRTLRACLDSGGPEHVESLQDAVSLLEDPQDPAQIWSFATKVQRIAVEQSATMATAASLQTEYVVGVLVAMVVGTSLIASAVSLLGGLAEALINVKAMFPGSQAPGWVIILTTLEALPLYAAFLGMLNQMIGDVWMSLACVFSISLLSLGAFTGRRMLNLKNGEQERQKLYRRIWGEYALRLILGTLIALKLFLWVANNDRLGLSDYVQKHLLTREVLIPIVLGYYSRKIITAVCGTDIVLGAFVQSELWQAGTIYGCPANEHVISINEVRRLIFRSSGPLGADPEAPESAPAPEPKRRRPASKRRRERCPAVPSGLE